MYFSNLEDLFRQIIRVFIEKRFWYSIKYIIWILIDRFRGYDFVKNEGYDKIGLDKNKSLVYQATRDTDKLRQALDFVFQNFGLSNANIIDIGCGKGYMLYRFSKYPFLKIGGVELSDYLYEKAKTNIERINDNRIELYHEDARCFIKYDDYTVVYMFNPFYDEIMVDVIENIKKSIERNPRHFFIIYKNPVCDEIVRLGGFKLCYIIKGKTVPYYIYTNVGIENE